MRIGRFGKYRERRVAAVHRAASRRGSARHGATPERDMKNAKRLPGDANPFTVDAFPMTLLITPPTIIPEIASAGVDSLFAAAATSPKSASRARPVCARSRIEKIAYFHKFFFTRVRDDLAISIYGRAEL